MNNLAKKFIVILLSSMLIFNTVIYAAADDETDDQGNQTSKEQSTEKKKDDKAEQEKAKEKAKSQAEADGEKFGQIDGALAGKKDYVNGHKSDYQKAMPKGNKLIDKFDLKTYSANERLEFIAAYREAFKESYRKAISEQLLEQYFSPAKRGEENGEKLGAAEGVASANVDLLNNDKSDWLLAYNNFLAEGSLMTRYQLKLQEASYSESFVIAFKASFKKNYRDHYDTYRAEQDLNNTTYHLARYNEDNIIYDKMISQVSNGSVEAGSLPTARLSIERGTVYQDTYLSLQRTKNVTLVENTTYDAVSGIYQISVQKDRDGIKLYKPLKLSFVYNDNPNIGVYQWVHNHWQYVKTVHDKFGVTVEIPAGIYHGGKYALFIDNSFKVPTDSVYSWAYRDIVLALKRNYIASTPAFRPDQSMTRYEMADLIYQVMRYRIRPNVKVVNMTDRASITGNPLPVDYALSISYMQLDENGAFNPSQYVSYMEFADIMRRLTKNATFDYGAVASKMFYERYAMSGYLNDKNGNPTRAEVVFALNEYIR